jgi:hypothetical protein
MRVGARILEVCEILEKLGPVGSGDIGKLMALAKTGEKPNAYRYCQRAVGMRLITVIKSPIGNSSHYNVYTVQPDWRERIKGGNLVVKQERSNLSPIAKRGVFSFASSIFQVGA